MQSPDHSGTGSARSPGHTTLTMRKNWRCTGMPKASASFGCQDISIKKAFFADPTAESRSLVKTQDGWYLGSSTNNPETTSAAQFLEILPSGKAGSRRKQLSQLAACPRPAQTRSIACGHPAIRPGSANWRAPSHPQPKKSVSQGLRRTVSRSAVALRLSHRVSGLFGWS